MQIFATCQKREITIFSSIFRCVKGNKNTLASSHSFISTLGNAQLVTFSRAQLFLEYNTENILRYFMPSFIKILCASDSEAKRFTAAASRATDIPEIICVCQPEKYVYICTYIYVYK